MKIAIAAPSYLPSRRANTVQVMKMAQALRMLGNEVILFVPEDDADHLVLGQNITWDQLALQYGLISSSFDIKWVRVEKYFRRYDFAVHVIWQALKKGVDLIYTRVPQVAGMASLLRLPAVYELHDFPHGKGGKWWLRRFLRGRGARKLVLISKALEESLTEIFVGDMKRISRLIAPDGIDLERYQKIGSPVLSRQQLAKQRCDLSLAVDRFTAGYTGHFYQGRGIELIMALAQITPDIQYLLAGGDPSDIERVRDNAQRMGLENVILTGFVPNSELPLYQASCDVLLMPYQHKVAASSGGDIAAYLSPMKLFEYMACRRVIIASDLPVLREVLNEENAILLPPDDIDAWYNAIMLVKKDKEIQHRLASRARKDVEAYTWIDRARRIMEGIA